MRNKTTQIAESICTKVFEVEEGSFWRGLRDVYNLPGDSEMSTKDKVALEYLSKRISEICANYVIENETAIETLNRPRFCND